MHDVVRLPQLKVSLYWTVGPDEALQSDYTLQLLCHSGNIDLHSNMQAFNLPISKGMTMGQSFPINLYISLDRPYRWFLKRQSLFFFRSF